MHVFRFCIVRSFIFHHNNNNNDKVHHQIRKKIWIDIHKSFKRSVRLLNIIIKSYNSISISIMVILTLKFDDSAIIGNLFPLTSKGKKVGNLFPLTSKGKKVVVFIWYISLNLYWLFWIVLKCWTICGKKEQKKNQL